MVKKRFGLTNKILLVVIPTMTTLMLLICLSSGIAGHTRIKTEVLTTFERIAGTAKMVVEEQLDSMLYSVSELGNYIDICSKTMTKDELNNYLAEKAKMNNFQTLYVTDAKGITNKGWDMSSYDFFKAAMGGDTYLTKPQITEDGGSAALTASAPIWKDGIENGEVVGIVCAVIDAQYISNLLGAIDMGETGSLYIIDEEGYTIADPEYENVLARENTVLESKKDKNLVDFANIEQTALKGKSAIGRVEYDGVTTLVSVVPMKEYGWVMGAYADSWEYMKGNIMNSYITTAFGVVFLICASIFLFFYLKKIINPLIDMSKIITKVSEGDYDVSVTYEENDEIGDMAKSVNTMIANNSACIEDVDNVLAQMAKGDFTVTTSANYIGIFRKIEVSMNNIVKSLARMVTEVRNTAENVSTGSDQVASGAMVLSQGTTEQASAVEELAAAIMDLNTNVKNTANNATVAGDITNTTYDELNMSSEQMKSLMEAMEKIDKTSRDIVHIIKSIEDIAFQTNILSLNASVEAARAGAVGKGFAVVADEVKALAGKAAEASKETTNLINQAMSAISEGMKCANITWESLETVVKNMNNAQARVNNIKEDMIVQAESLSQVALSIEQISSVTQSNSATSEESAAASEVLAQQATYLKNIVSSFKTK